MQVAINVFHPEPPSVAESLSHRAVFVGDAAGRCEIFAWDSGSGQSHQLTDRPQGTVTCAIEPSGERVWWFDDDLTGSGQWHIQPFDGSEPAAAAGLPSGRNAGLAMTADGTAVVGVGSEQRLLVFRRHPDATVELITTRPSYRQLIDVSATGDLLVLAGEPDSPAAVEVISIETETSVELSGEFRQLWPAGFAPTPQPHEQKQEPPRLLLATVDDDGYRVALWTPLDGLSVLDWCVFDTEIAVSWYPDGNRVLVRQNRHARSTLHVLDLVLRCEQSVATPVGTILAATVQPDGDLHYVWTDSTHAPQLKTSSGRQPAATIDVPDRQPGRRFEAWVPTSAGSIHALLAVPPGPGPHPGVFLLHGGPFESAMDAYNPLASVLLSIGCAVVRLNYRGSSGYGSHWREDFSDGVGLTQLADLAAVRSYLVEEGVIDEHRTAVCGESWGGYLALLAAGVQPHLWRVVTAVNPIADYPAAFAESTSAVQALDIRLFGGTPDEHPLGYTQSSPATYADDVRAPVLLLVGSDDPKCPPAQVRSYADRLSARGHPVELHTLTSGHEGYRIDLLVEILSRVAGFVGTGLGGRDTASLEAR